MRILVIEDNKKHLNDGRQYSKQLINCTVDFATTLAEAMELLQKNNYDGAVSDVFFPAEIGTSPETFENAITINNQLVERGVHVVFNTSGNHHGQKYLGFIEKTTINPLGGEDTWEFRTSGGIIEAYPKDEDADADTKQWEAAFRYILLVEELFLLPDKGSELIQKEEKNLTPFPYGDYGELTKKLRECRQTFILEVFKKYNA